jgi:hypothetical protein
MGPPYTYERFEITGVPSLENGSACLGNGTREALIAGSVKSGEGVIGVGRLTENRNTP